jgi:hypothetical protein
MGDIMQLHIIQSSVKSTRNHEQSSRGSQILTWQGRKYYGWSMDLSKNELGYGNLVTLNTAVKQLWNISGFRIQSRVPLSGNDIEQTEVLSSALHA